MNPNSTAIAEFLNAVAASSRLGPQVVHHQLLPPRTESLADTRRPWPRMVQGLLSSRGIERLYSHQALGCDLVRAGRNVIAATPTASGKSLVYVLPILEACLARPESRALLVYPLKALAQDQLRAFREMTQLFPPDLRPTAAIYDGDTPRSEREKIRRNPPNVILTNPEMVHLSMLPYHHSWSVFLSGLDHVVVDEAHTCRGVMGSHVAHVLRRLRRVCSWYGSRPVFVLSSATVGNPGELAGRLTGLDFEVVEESGAPRGARHFMFLDPQSSPSTTAIRVLEETLPRGLRTIVYTGSRKMTELISLWAREHAREYENRISAYRAGYLPEERRDIEAGLASGDLLAVISTSALELGIDIGELDVCVLVGYPGTVMQTMQRGGRVGRKQQESAVMLVAGEDALDQYFIRHPDLLLSSSPEPAVLNPANPVILANHLECAAAELPLRPGEELLAEEGFHAAVEDMLTTTRLLASGDGKEIFSRRKRPHRDVSLRGSGDTFAIQAGQGDDSRPRIIGEIDMVRAFLETHDGAVYLHRGQTFLVDRLDVATRTAHVVPHRAGYYTRPLSRKSTQILETHRTGLAGTAPVGFGRLRVTQEVHAYEKRSTRGGQLLGTVPLDLPPLVFETEGMWYAIPDDLRRAAEADLYHFMGGIHAMEHAAIGFLPLLVLTDRNDLGGISTPLHEQLGTAAVFIYDGIPGGVGLTRQAFTRAGEILANTASIVAECQCELGCPACVHSPKCGSGNRPIAKDAALYILRGLSGTTGPAGHPPAPASPEPDRAATRPCPPDRTLEQARPHHVPRAPADRNLEQARAKPLISRETRFCVLDVETRRSARECGGWHMAARMGVAVAVLYDSGADEFLEFTQDQVPHLITRLREAELVVGFNSKRFDYKVLAGVHPFDPDGIPSLDMLEMVRARLGYRLSLANLARATLGAPKTGDGLQSLEWWKQGRVDKIAEYCRQDVALTRDLYLFGLDCGHLLFTNKAGRKVRLPLDWNQRP